MDSPQRRRIPPQVPPPIVPPPQFNIHVPNPEPVSQILLLNIDCVLSKINIIILRPNITTFLLISNNNMPLFHG